MSRELHYQINIKFARKEFEKLMRVSEKFGLERSEVIRRSVAEGLKAFAKANIPGSPAERLDTG